MTLRWMLLLSVVAVLALTCMAGWSSVQADKGDGAGPSLVPTASPYAMKQYCYACKVMSQGKWMTYRQTQWKSYCDENDKDAMLDLRDNLRNRGVRAKVVEKEREVN